MTVASRVQYSPIARDFLIRECRKRKRSLAYLLLLTIVGTFLELIGIGIIFPVIFIKIDPVTVESHRLYGHLEAWLGITEVNQLIYWLIGIMVTAFFLRNLHLIYLTYVRTRMLNGWKEDLARELMQAYLRVPYPYIIKKTSPVLIRNVELTGAVFDRIVISIISLVSNFILVFAIVGLIAIIQPVITITAAVCLFAIILLQNRYMKKALIAAGDMTTEGVIDTHKALQQSLGVARECRLTGRTNFFVKHFVESHKKISRAYLTSQVLKTVPPLITQFLLMVIICGMLLFLMSGEHSKMAFPSLGLMAMAAFRLAPRFNNVQYAINTLHEGKKSLERVAKEFHELSQLLPQQPKKMALVPVTREVALENAAFSYNGKAPWLFEGASLSLARGDFVGIMGASGAGKSTFIDILLGLLPPTQGQVLVDGKPLASNQGQHLISAGFVAQAPFFFSGSIRDNVAFGISAEEIDDARVAQVLDLVKLSEHVASLPEGVHSSVGDNAGQLSGGQRQRLAIARALYTKPDFLVLDEPTSALDAGTEEQMIALIATLRKEATILLITHRLSTLKYCSKLLYIADRRIDVSATVAELTERNHRFAEMMDAAERLQHKIN